MTRYYAVADRHLDGTYWLTIYRRADGTEVWGDSPAAAARWEAIPALATERLRHTAFAIVGEWVDQGDAWTADAEVG